MNNKNIYIVFWFRSERYIQGQHHGNLHFYMYQVIVVCTYEIL